MTNIHTIEKGSGWQRIYPQTIGLQNNSYAGIFIYLSSTVAEPSVDAKGTHVERGKQFQLFTLFDIVWVKRNLTLETELVDVASATGVSTPTLAMGGTQDIIGLFGGKKVSVVTQEIGLIFDLPLDLETDVVVENDATGVVASQFNGTLLRVGRTGVGVSALESMRTGRYVAGATKEIDFTYSCNQVPTGTNKVQIGYFAEHGSINGVFLEHNVGGMDVVYANGVGGYAATHVSLDMANFDFTLLTRFKILFGYLGVGNIMVYAHNGDEYVLVGVAKTDTALTARTHIGSTRLPFRVATATTDAQTLDAYVASVRVANWGETRVQDKYFSFSVDTSTAIVSGEKEILGFFRGDPTFAGGVANIVSRLSLLEVATSHTGMFRINILKLPLGTEVTDGAWVEIDPQSPLQINTTSLLDSTGAKVKASKLLTVSDVRGAVGNDGLDFTKLDVVTRRGSTFALELECTETSETASDVLSLNCVYFDEH